MEAEYNSVPPQSAPADPEVDFVALRPGTTIGRYEVLALLGQGGFGITYLARDAQLGREVAIKEYLPISLAIRQDGTTVLPRSTKVAEDFTWGRDRFVAEGRTLATLHRAPGIVHVFDFLEINGTAYIVMEMLHGDTLEARLKKVGRLGADDIDRIAWTLLEGLQQVHETGFLHRDIKPSNIMLDAAGNPTLIDFGASRAAIAGRTTAMTAIFTPGYAAAEQMTSAKQGPWTDIYGLSATLYHAIAGRAPPSAFDRMLDDPFEPIIRLAGPDFAPGLLRGIDAGLAIRASDRPQSIAGWRTILSMDKQADPDATQISPSRNAGSTAAILARPSRAHVWTAAVPRPAEPALPAPSKGRRNLLAGITAMALLLAGVGGYFVLAPAPSSKSVSQGTALNDMKVEDLERVLAERRAADAAAAEKRRLEDEARLKVEKDAAAKRQADTDLEKAQQQRQKAEEELAKLKAQIEERRKEEQGQVDVAVQRKAAEVAQRKAEDEMASLRQIEDDARQKVAAEIEAKRLGDEALVKAQGERQRADEEARQKAEEEIKRKAEADSKQLAEAEARLKADAALLAEKKAAEGAEVALRLLPADRQRVQLALTSMGFDTRGTDGSFGPRSREMIASWQKARSLPVTGFLNSTQQQALLREAAPALSRIDDEQKKAEDNKKADDAKKAAASTTPAATAPAPASTAVLAGGRWTGQFKCNAWPTAMIMELPSTGGQMSGKSRGGAAVVTITINGDQFSGNLKWLLNDVGKTLTGSFSGTVAGNRISVISIARSDVKSFQGLNEDQCKLDLSRAGG